MRRKNLDDMGCPIACGLDKVGEWWSILILRDVSFGLKRFDEFQKSLGIAPNMLSKRLEGLVAAGLLEKRLYNEKPPRYEYIATRAALDFRPVLMALMTWGNQYFPPQDADVRLIDRETGEEVIPVFTDPRNGEPVNQPRYKIVRTPRAAASADSGAA